MTIDKKGKRDTSTPFPVNIVSEERLNKRNDSTSVYISESKCAEDDKGNGKTCYIPRDWLVRGKLAVFDLGLYFTDTGTDLYTIYEHIINCNYYWAITTAIFMMLPSLPVFITYMKTKVEDIKAGKFKWPCGFFKNKDGVLSGLIFLHSVTIGYFSGGIIFVSLYQIFITIKGMSKMLLNPSRKDNTITDIYQKDAFRGKFMECQLEAAPQCIFQVR